MGRADVYVARYEVLDSSKLKVLGVRVLLCDLDYTLCPGFLARPPGTLIDWLNELLDNGIEVAIVSNNFRKGKVRRFAADRRLRKPIPFMWCAEKPTAKCIRWATTLFRAYRAEMALMGNRYDVDMRCAKEAGVLAIKVPHRFCP